MKKVSDIFNSIKFASVSQVDDTKHKGGSTDDEEHYTVGEKEYAQQLQHVKKRAGQEVKEEHLEEKNVPTSPEKWAQAKAQAKAKFDVYPSAYANGWAAKKYKEMGGGWKSVSEEVKDKFDIGEYDQEGDMAKSDLRSIMANAKRVHDMLDDSTNLPEWVQSKITLAEDYISTVANYMTSEMSESTSWSKTGKEATHRETGEKTYEYHQVDKEGKPTGKREYRNAQGKSMGESVELEEGQMKRMATDKEEDERLSKPPFDKPYTTTKGTVTDKSGAKHTAMSRARDLARQAAKKQSEYAKARKAGSSTKNAQARAAGANNLHMFESRQLEIVKEAMKSAKKKKETKTSDDTFQAEPELASQIVKTN